MKTLFPLVAMQLKDKLDFNFKANWRKTLFKVIFDIIKFMVITGLIYAGLYVLSILRLVDLTAGIPDKFLLIIFTIMMMLSFLTCTIGLVKSLYYAKDNQFLLTMPTSRVNIFFSKLIVYYLYELIRNIYFLLPLFIAFGMVNGYTFLYFVWSILAVIWLTALSVMVGAILSIPAMYISMLTKNIKPLLYIITLAFIGFIVWGLVALINLIPTNFNLIESWGTTFWEIQDFINKFYTIFIPFAWILEAVIGTRYGVTHSMLYGRQWLCLLGSILVVVALIIICYFIVRPLFFHFASSPFEYKRNYDLKPKRNKKHPAFISALKNEIIKYLRTPSSLFVLLGTAIGMPIAILLLNKIYNAMDTRLQGAYMTIMFNILVIMLILLSSSVTMASVYSRDGNSAYLSKTNPQPYFNSLIVRLIPNAVLMTISLIVTVVVLKDHASSFINPTLLFFCLESFYLGHLLWSAELDLMNPQIEQYAETGTHTYNPNEIKSTLYALVISALLAVITFLLIGEGVTAYWIKAMIVGIVFFIVRLYFYIMKIKVFYKEK